MFESLFKNWIFLEILKINVDGNKLIPYKHNTAITGAGWSSPVARRAHNPKVVGSNPAPATNLLFLLNPCFHKGFLFSAIYSFSKIILYFSKKGQPRVNHFSKLLQFSKNLIEINSESSFEGVF